MLPSPIIEGTLPAFYYSEIEGCAILAIPFSMSRAVSESEVHGFKLKIKDIQNYEYLLTLTSSEIQFNNGIVKFRIDKATLDDKFLEGQFYKAQLAYIGRDLQGREKVGHYSTVGIIKYTTKPTVEILNLNSASNNAHIYTYTGSYSQKGKDVSEKVYAYRFIIRDGFDSIIEDTGFIVHNNSSDTNHYESTDVFKFSKELAENEKYSITYIVKTNNNLEISSPQYRIMNKKSIMSTLSAKLIAELNYENGYVQLNLEGDKDINGFEKLATGTFTVARAAETSNYTDWEDLFEFSLVAQKPSIKSWKDFTIQQGIKYRYSVQQHNKKGLQSAKILSNIIYANFEYCFLYDGERQLKIKFNPKMSSFKKDILESKVDTLGSKYPFIFRNGQVEYKEFPIQGLISYLSDDEGLFSPDIKDLFFTRNREFQVKYKENKSNPLRELAKVDDINELKARRNTYMDKKAYLYYYVFDTKTGTYKRWTDYAKSLPPRKAPNGKPSQFFKLDFQDWDSIYRYYTEIVYSPSGVRIENPPQPPYSIFDAIRVNVNALDYDSRQWATTNPTAQNVFIEREFKLDVLNWLTNGKPKLFKSPTEGNYIVRLMNISLSPLDQLGRMLHSFQATAYEIADMSYKSLVDYGIIGNRYDTAQYLRVVTIPLCTDDKNYVDLSPIDYVYDENVDKYFATGNLLKKGVQVLKSQLVDVNPGTVIYIDDAPIVIGSSGMYDIPFEVSSISLKEGTKSHGLLTIQYMSSIIDTFNQIERVETEEILGKQIIGECKNVLDAINNITSQAVTFYDIRMHKRPIIDLHAEAFTTFVDVPSEEVNETNYKDYYCEFPIYDVIELTKETYEPQKYYYKVDEDWYFLDFNDFDPTRTYYEIVDYRYDAATIYSLATVYFKKINGFEVFENEYSREQHGESLLTYHVNPEMGMYELVKNNLKPDALSLYRFALDYDEILKTYLYKEQIFESDTDKKDIKVDEEDIDRSLTSRLTTNNFLNHERDFKWYVQNELLYYFDKERDKDFVPVLKHMTWKSNQRYFTREPIYYVFDPFHPDIFYLDKETYELFAEVLYSAAFKQQSPNVFRKYKKVSYVVFLDEDTTFDFTDRETMNTGPIGMFKTLSIPAGLYCELFYQNQFIYHDISQNANLVLLRAELDKNEEILSRDYMQKQCATPDGEKRYIEELKKVNENYNLLKMSYLKELEVYLKKLEEEGYN